MSATESSDSRAPTPEAGRLTAEDLIPDRALAKKDSDEFRYVPIAERLSELVRAGEAPLNVALFGPWGSGKSSVYELLRRQLDPHAQDVALVRYDAWKYGGKSLQRNFISHAATALDYPEGIDKNAEFHRGLYERRRTAELDFRDLKKTNFTPLLLFVGLFVALVVAFALLVGLASLATDEDFLGEIARTLPGFLVSTGVVAALVAGAKLVLDGANVDVEQSQPSAEEEFAKTFDKLLTRARKEQGYKRFVFFVDELDRCSPDDVVATLTAIKTFLGHENCIFVVAADRTVLETALEALPQTSPYDKENPYYSSASSFFDKVFQHQVPLPPLRGRRLTRFARDLVVERGGLWKQLRGVEPRGRLLDRVIYVLIPSHVRSPRRVKVLLNSFATNVRIAESRGVDWRERGPEIAKLTVLQTEFPLLAADLQHAPRLPSLLLNASPTTVSDRVKKLLDRHGGPHKSSSVNTESLGDASATDPPLDGDVPAVVEARLIETQHQQLRRYLERTADIPDPGRDLLYLEAAGAAFGLEDAALGELLEAEAPESPKRVVDEARQRSHDQQLLVMRVLADMCDQEFGDERKNVMTALMGVIEVASGEMSEAGDVVVAALRGFQEEQDLAVDHLPGAFQVALAVEDDSDHPLTTALFEREELLITAERVQDVASSLDSVPPVHRPAVYARVAEEFTETPAVLTEALPHLSDDGALEVLRAAPVRDVLNLGLDSSNAVEVADSLYDAAGHSPQLLAMVQRQALSYPGAYPSVRAHAGSVLERLPQDVVDEHVLIGLDWAPASDWPYWTERLSDGSAHRENHVRWAAEAAASIIKKVASENASEEAVAAALPALLPFLDGLVDEKRTEIVTAVQGVLEEHDWWTDGESRETQNKRHVAVRSLLDAPDVPLAAAAAKALADDIRRAKTATIVVSGVWRSAATSPEGLRGARIMGEALPSATAAEIYNEWKDLPPADEVAGAYRLTHTLVALAASALRGDVSVNLTGLDAERLIAATTQFGQAGPSVFHYWLRLEPNSADLAQALTPSLAERRQARDDLKSYVGHLDDERRTELVGAMLDTHAVPVWVQLVSEHGVDDESLTDRIAAAAEAATSVDEREKQVRLLVALRPGTMRSQRRVADLIVHLLDTGKKGDFNVSLRAAEALGDQHRSADRLKRAFTASVEKNKFEIPPKATQALARAEVRLPKKTFTKEAWDVFKGFWH